MGDGKKKLSLQLHSQHTSMKTAVLLLLFGLVQGLSGQLADHKRQENPRSRRQINRINLLPAPPAVVPGVPTLKPGDVHCFRGSSSRPTQRPSTSHSSQELANTLTSFLTSLWREKQRIPSRFARTGPQNILGGKVRIL